jgi:F-type H+-transporting ATPase subunit epsilon
MANSAVRAEEIDLERAEAARRRAEERLRDRSKSAEELARAQAALRRSMARIKVARERTRRQKPGPSAQ